MRKTGKKCLKCLKLKVPKVVFLFITLVTLVHFSHSELYAETAMINSFSHGEVTDKIRARTDVEQWYSSARILENMFVKPWGPVEKRPGTYYIDVNYIITEVPGVDVWGDYTEFFVGVAESIAYRYTPLCNATSESAIDTTWGTDGYWGDTLVTDAREGTQLSDGSIFVIRNDYTITKLDSDGAVDATWGTAGSYVHPQSMPFYKILVDDDGNAHLFSWSGGVDARYTYIKLDSDGAFVGGLTRSTTKVGFINDAQWADDDKTRIIAVGQTSKSYSGTWPNMIAINPVTYAIDTTWDGNLSLPGYAQIIGDYPMPIIYNMRIASDGGIVCHRNNSVLLIKILSDGSGLDTTWGTNGQVDFSNVTNGYTMMREIDNYGDDIFVLSRETVEGSTRIKLNHLDEDGTLTDSYTVPDSSQYTYTLLKVFNDKLILGGNADNDVEIWTQDFTKESGFDLSGAVAAVHFVIPDETSKTHTVTPDTEIISEIDPRRLIGFEYPQDKPYVIALGDKQMAFFKSD